MDQLFDLIPAPLQSTLFLVGNYIPYTLYSTVLQLLDLASKLSQPFTNGSSTSSFFPPPLASLTIPQLALLAFIAYLSLQLLRYSIAYFLSWLWLLLRLAVIVAVGLLVLQLYSRGADGAWQWADGWWGELSEVWSKEYERYSAAGAGARSGQQTHTGYRRYTDSLYGGGTRQPGWPGWAGGR